ncbi:3-hydroxy-9,10-secoandrosta-1,3,5(10)-triene-9,17-dione monooxygenase reductase subunit [Amycolatopsis thermophila]|uniref:3-hydroxy-9,10-secoandrosta-1,3,5(10)-triene-9, 17-dione monooxygenase reductase component n=1 Tax=Amycolatopsis thermophila TaxID=206084 RepID=A0ABU0EXW5_9PSEU|nr:3-hydroxy-9,10-secoandrosta-1,3,5(10)-triene-9,17-dione monooxygenase reductase subunit [Amycolatopsis thermophila]MDQ0380161.1 3-hydroxy-9,10-secoandrosta-1,3,5(10)-triene-9,17-dione monooxygenase reductase component [Amycolatopsis thermophila]
MISSAIEPARFRQVLGHFATGVTVVTTMDGDEPAGFACQSFAALSLDPPLVLFCPARRSRTWPLIERNGRFAVNVLAEGQHRVSTVFGARGTDKFADVGWEPAPSGSPILEDALTWVDCAVETVFEAGDHFVVVGRVTALGEPSNGRPLLFYRGQYTGAAPVKADVLSWAGPDDWL